MTATPPAAEQYAKNANKSAAPGLPSEDEIYAALKPWTVTFRSEHRRRTARAILSLIRPAFEAKDAEIRKLALLLDKQMGTPCEQIRHQQEIEALQAKLAQAVEALRQIKALKPQPIADTGFATGPLALLTAAQRIARDELTALRSASAAARGETTALASGKE